MTVFSGDDDEWEDELRSAYAERWQDILKALKNLRTQIRRVMESGSDAKTIAAWKQVDGTRPSKNIHEVSYRYPFVDATTSHGVAPRDWTAWDKFQGAEPLVRDAIAKLIQRATSQIKIWKQQT